MINANSLFQDTGYFSDRNECGIPVGVGDGSGGGDTGSSGGGGGEGPGDHYSGQRSTGEGHGEHYGSQRSTEEKEFFYTKYIIPIDLTLLWKQLLKTYFILSSIFFFVNVMDPSSGHRNHPNSRTLHFFAFHDQPLMKN